MSTRKIFRIVWSVAICIATVLCLIPIIILGVTGERAINFLPYQVGKKVSRYNEVVKIYQENLKANKFDEIKTDYSFPGRSNLTAAPLIREEGRAARGFEIVSSVKPTIYTGAFFEVANKTYGSETFDITKRFQLSAVLRKEGLSNNVVTANFDLFRLHTANVPERECISRGGRFSSNGCSYASALYAICFLVDPVTLNFQNYLTEISKISTKLPPKSSPEQKSQVEIQQSRVFDPTTNGCSSDGEKFNVAKYKFIDYKYVSSGNRTAELYPLKLSFSVREALDPELFWNYDVFEYGNILTAFLSIIQESVALVAIAIILFIGLCIALIVFDICLCCTCLLPEGEKGQYKDIENQ